MTKINFRRKEENRVIQENVSSEQNKEKSSLITEKGSIGISDCSATAQQGTSSWWKKFRDAAKPIFEELRSEMITNTETCQFIGSNPCFDYREKLEAELKTIIESEMGQAGPMVRKLKPGIH